MGYHIKLTLHSIARTYIKGSAQNSLLLSENVQTYPSCIHAIVITVDHSLTLSHYI